MISLNLQNTNPNLARILNILLIALLAYYLSTIFWQYYSPNISLQQKLVNPSLTISKENKILQNLFVSYSLFGVEPIVNVPAKIVQPKRVRAPVPKISLEVRGVLLLGNITFAIIEMDGVQEAYTISEYISYLYISDITADYVEFDHDGYKQKVYITDDPTLVGSGANEGVVNNSQPQATQVQSQITETLIGGENVISPALNNSQQARLLQLKSSLRSNPLQVIGAVNFIPYRETGQIAGFQVTPGRERELFKASGLLSGDIILSVNNQSLSHINDFTKGVQFMNKLGSASELDIIIRRQGQRKRIFLRLQN